MSPRTAILNVAQPDNVRSVIACTVPVSNVNLAIFQEGPCDQEYTSIRLKQPMCIAGRGLATFNEDPYD